MLQKKVQNNVYINGKYNFLISKLSLLVICTQISINLGVNTPFSKYITIIHNQLNIFIKK